jgi:hypothetical protein
VRWARCIKIGKNDTTFIYYSGHGAIRGGEHYLTLSHKGPGGHSPDLSRRRLWQEFEQKPTRPQLGVLITDCCADFDIPVGIPVMSGAADNWYIFQDLFFGLTGKVDINACGPGQVSLCNRRAGGFYTHGLTWALTFPPARQANARVTWGQFLQESAQVMLRPQAGAQDPCFFHCGPWD